MKKLLLVTAIAGLTALPASADTVLGGDVSYSYFSPDTEFTSSGSAKATSSDGHPTSLEASIEHPFPLIPNVKVRYIDSDVGLSVGGVSYDYKYEATDFIFYYELVDTDLVSVDAGVTVSDISNDLSSSNQRYDNYVFGGYANAEIGLPNTPLSLYAQAVIGFASSDSGTTTSDIQAGIRYAVISNAGAELTLNAGYRIIENDYDDFGSGKLNGKFRQDGFFGGASLDF